MWDFDDIQSSWLDTWRMRSSLTSKSLMKIQQDLDLTYIRDLEDIEAPDWRHGGWGHLDIINHVSR